MSGRFRILPLAFFAAAVARGEDYDFPDVAVSDWASSAAVRVDARGTLGGRIVHGTETRGEPDGSAVEPWDTTELEDGWHAIESVAEVGRPPETVAMLALNAPEIAVEGGRLSASAVWTSNATHLVRNWVVVPNGITLTVATNAVVKMVPGAGIRVEDGGTLRFVGAEGAEPVVTSVTDGELGMAIDCASYTDASVGGIVRQSSAATIEDNTHVRFTFAWDQFPTVSIQDASAKRSDGVARIPVTVSGTARDTAFRVNWRAVDGSAVFGEDYLLASGTLSWAKSGDGTRHIEIPLDTENLRGSNTAFRVELLAHYACNISRTIAEVVVREFDFPDLSCSGWIGSPTIRFDAREGIAGAVATGVEGLGEPDGATNRLWDTTALADGWHTVESTAVDPPEERNLLVLNPPPIENPVEGPELLAFIQSSGTEWIDSGYRPGPETRVQTLFQFLERTEQGRVFGVESGTLFFSIYQNGNGYWAYAFRNNSGNWISTSKSTDTVPHLFDFNVAENGGRSLTIDNGGVYRSTLSGSPSQTASYPLAIGGSIRDGGLANYFSKHRIYWMRIYEGDELVRDFVPAVWNGATGLWDRVELSFHGNAGVGGYVGVPATAAFAVEGGRLAASAVWGTGATHLVRHTVVVPSGMTLSILPGAVVKFLPGTFIKVEDGGALSVLGEPGNDAIFTSVADDRFGVPVDCGEHLGFEVAPSNGIGGIVLQSSAATFADNAHLQIHSFEYGVFPYVKLNDTIGFREGGMAYVPVSIASGTRNQPFSIDWEAVDGTAAFGEDYALASGTIEWTGTSQGNQTLEIPLVRDVVRGETTSFKLRIKVCRGCNPSGTGECTVSIRELDTIGFAASSASSAPVRFDSRESIGGRIVHGVETRGEPDGSAATPWNTSSLSDGWHAIESGGASAEMLSINDPAIAVEGGRLASDTVWDDSQTHLVRHWVVVPNGVTLTVTDGTVVKLCPDAGIRVEDGGRLVVNGVDGADAIFTTIDDPVESEQSADGDEEEPASTLLGHYTFSRANLLEAKVGANAKESSGRGTVSYSDSAQNLARVEDTAVLSGRAGAVSVPVGTGFSIPVPADADGANWALAMDFYVPGGVGTWRTFFSLSQQNTADGALFIRNTDGQVGQGTYQAFSSLFGAWHQLAVSTENGTSAYWIDGEKASLSKNWTLTPGGWLHLSLDNDGEDGEMLIGQVRLYGEAKPTELFPDGFSAIVLPPVADDGTPVVSIESLKSSVSKGTRLAVRIADAGGSACALRAVVSDSVGSRIVSLSVAAASGLHEFDLGSLLELQPGTTYSVFVEAENALAGKTAQTAARTVLVPVPSDGIDWTELDAGTPGGIVILPSGTFQDNGWYQLRGVSCNAPNIGALSIHNAEVSRKAGMAYVAVTVSGNTRSQSFTADWEVVPGTATWGNDYKAVSGRLMWSKSSEGTKWIEIPINKKTEAGARRTFKVWLRTVRGMTGTGGEATVEVREYDEGALDAEEVAFFPEGEGSEPFAVDEPVWKEPIFRHETEPIRLSGAWQNTVDPAETVVRLSWEGENGSGVLAEGPGGEPATYAWRAEDWNVGSYVLRHDILDAGSGRRLATYEKTFAVPSWEGVELHGGTLTSNETWRAGVVHVVYETVYVPALYTILLEPGAIVKFLTGTGITIESGGGALFANGVVFTHINDDTVGGDTLNDGNTLVPVEDAYAFKGELTIGDESELRYKTQAPLSGTISGARKLTRGSTYRVSGNVTIASGATLTIPAGTILKFDPNVQMTVNSGGTLVSDGTRAAPVVFTSIKDDEFGGDTNGDGDESSPDAGDWTTIKVAGGRAELHNTKILYSSRNQTTGAINMNGGTVVFDGGEIAHGLYDAVGVESGNFFMTNAVIRDCLLAFRHWARDPIVNCVIYDCGRLTQGGGQTFVNCVFSGIDETWEAFGFPKSTYRNCVFWNEGGSVLTGEGTQDALSVCGSNGNRWGDPMFRDADAGDYRIREGSACIDAADASAAPALDLYGQKRWMWGADGTAATGAAIPDIGVAECVPRNAASDIDLVPVSLTCDAASAKPGQTLFLHWRTANGGGEAVETEWWDEIALVSASGRVTVLGEKVQSNRIAAGGETTGTGYFAVPALAEGTYAIRLQVNSRRDVPEGTRTDNNALVVEGALEIVVDSATIEDGAVGTLLAGGIVVRRFDFGADAPATLVRVRAPAGAVVRWGFGNEVGSNEAVVDGVGETIFAVPDGTEELYVALEGGGEAGLYDIVFEDGSLAVSSVSPSSVPRSGRVTLRVSGAGFGEDAALAFVAPSGVEVAPLSLVRESAEVLWATVDCAALAASGQTYGVRVSTDDNEFFKPASLAITATEGKGMLELKYSIPESVRSGRVFMFTVIYRNVGNVDLTCPLITVLDTGDDIERPVEFSLDGECFSPGGLQFVGADANGMFNGLRPGDQVTLHVRAKIPSGNNGSAAIAVRANTESDIMAQYTTEIDRFFTPGMKAEFSMSSDEEMRARGDRLQRVFGATNGEMVQNFAVLAKRFYDCNGFALQLVDDLIPYGVALAKSESEAESGEGTESASSQKGSAPKLSFGSQETGVYVYFGGNYTLLSDSVDLTGQTVALIAHGWNSSMNERWVKNMASALSAWYDVVLCVNWETEADGLIPNVVASRIPGVASRLSLQLWGSGIELNKSMFIGHSFGSHLTGEIARNVSRLGHKSLGEHQQLFRHVGLDTATDAAMPNTWSLIGNDVAQRVEYYRSSQWAGLASPYAHFNYIVCSRNGFDKTILSTLGQHSLAHDWFLDSINSPAARDNHVGYWLDVENLPYPCSANAFCGVIYSNDQVVECTYPYYDLVNHLGAKFYPANKSAWSSMRKAWVEAADISVADALETYKGHSFLTGDQYRISVNLTDVSHISTIDRTDAFSQRVVLSIEDPTSYRWTELAEKIQNGNHFELDFTIPHFLVDADTNTCLLKVYADHGRVGENGQWIPLQDIYPRDNMSYAEVVVKRGRNPIPAINGKTNNGFVLRYKKTYSDETKYHEAQSKGETIEFLFSGRLSEASEGRKIESYSWRDSIYGEEISSDIAFTRTYSATESARYPICLTVVDDQFRQATVSGVLEVSVSIGDGEPVEQPQSIDPNEVVGPTGGGDPDTERFVQPGEWLDYTIYFENATNATASAMQVRITEDLDEHLDWDSLELGEIVFANETDRGLAGLHSGMSEYAVPGTNYTVRTAFELRNGVASWHIRMVDPDGDEDGWPLDAYAGFLPPNITNHIGEGHVSYRIKVRDDAPKNVRVGASADIVFDWNDAIPTDPSWWNMTGHLPVDLTFDRNCDDVVLGMPAAGTYSCDAPEFGTPAREGWIFLGWADTNGVACNCGADLPYGTTALDLFAQWREEVETKFATIAVDGGVLIAGLAEGETCPEDLVIPATLEIGGRRVKVVGVADDAFKGRRAIRTLTVMEGVRSIGARSFMNCTSLESISLPSTVESIGENAFYGCRLLGSVVIAAESPPALGSDAFRSVAAIGTLRVPEGAEAGYAAWIGVELGSAWAIEGYDPGSPPEPGEPAWTLLADQNRLVYAAGATDVRWTIDVSIATNGDVTLLRASTTDERGAALALPDPVLDEEGATHRIVAIGENGGIAAEGVFEGLDLGAVSIPESVVSIAPFAFANCAELAEIVFAGDEPSLRTLGAGAFFGCTALRSVWMDTLFDLSELGGADDPLGVFESCWNLSDVVLPCYVDSIGAFAFQDCSRLRMVTFDGFDGARIRSIGMRAFYNCDSLSDVNWEALLGLRELGEAAFGGDTLLTAPKIRSATFHRDFAALGDGAFLNAGSLTEITCFANTPPSRGTDVFRGVARTGVLHVPAAVAEDYTNQTARAWIGPEAGKLPPWNGTNGWTVVYLDASDELRRREAHLTNEEFESFLSLATLLGFTESELCAVDHPAEALVPDLRIVSFDPDATLFPVSILFENGIDETPGAAFNRLRAASPDHLWAIVSDELGGEERRVKLQSGPNGDGIFGVYLGTVFDKNAPSQFVRIVIEGD